MSFRRFLVSCALIAFVTAAFSAPARGQSHMQERVAMQCETGTVTALSEGSVIGSFHVVSFDKSSDDVIWLNYHSTKIYGKRVAYAEIANGDRVAVTFHPGTNGLTATRVDRLTPKNEKCK